MTSEMRKTKHCAWSFRFYRVWSLEAFIADQSIKKAPASFISARA